MNLRRQQAGIHPEALAFEDLYGPDTALARTTLVRVLNGLTLSRGAAEDEEMLITLRGAGDQHTRDRYARFQGIGDLRAGLDALPRPVFDRLETAAAP